MTYVLAGKLSPKFMYYFIKCKQIDLKACDLGGIWRHVTISRSQLDRALKRGIGIDGSSYGFKRGTSSDMALIPDLQTATRDPFYKIPTLSLICNIRKPNGTESPLDPRSVAQRAEKYLTTLNLGQGLWSPELEFFIKKGGKYYADSDFKGTHYQITPPSDRSHKFRSQVVRILEGAHYPWKYHHAEGAPGQVEIEVPFTTLFRSADGVMMAKYIIENVAHQYDLEISFSPKLGKEIPGSGMHVHQYLTRRGKSLFYDKKGSYAFLSQIALWYIGGLLKHAPTLSAFTNPTPKSYARFGGSQAPAKLFYSLGDRSAAIRIPRYALYPDEERIEYRPPDATCNIYLALAALLMAGIDGIINKIDPEKEGFGPGIPKNKLKSLPTSAKKAKTALRKDYKFLLRGNVFTPRLIATQLKL